LLFADLNQASTAAKLLPVIDSHPFFGVQGILATW